MELRAQIRIQEWGPELSAGMHHCANHEQRRARGKAKVGADLAQAKSNVALQQKRDSGD